ncbi:DMT family transporter [Rhodospira trueperi]|uniref:EamA domain-containing membrane protein RarD n=1 Tax=Rhodospira trueperi TaxID=69960 RepID=A0A1G7FQ99_9PROT|nr:EamA family transporter [Rhodospira trueperi]SDE78086.1 EamA domain-containing membrane protein RarD [Rhodospira trueperi]
MSQRTAPPHPARPHDPARGVALAMVCLVILGMMPVIANSRPDGFHALGFAVFLSVWQVVVTLPLFVRELRGPDRGLFATGLEARERRRLIGVGLLTGAMFGASTYLYVLGVERAGAVSAAIAIQAYPLFAMLWEALFLKRAKTPLELALTAGLMVGLYYLGTGGTWHIAGVSPWFLVALGVPFLWSVAHVLIKEELGRTPITPVQVTFFRVMVSTVVLLFVALALDPGVLAEGLGRWDFQAWALLMGAVYTVELIVWFHAVRSIDVSLASSITTPWPAVTMVLAVVVLGESVAVHEVVAFLVVAASLYGLIGAGLRAARRRAPC